VRGRGRHRDVGRGRTGDSVVVIGGHRLQRVVAGGDVAPGDAVGRRGVHAQRGAALEELHLGDRAVAVAGIGAEGDVAAGGEAAARGGGGQADGGRLVDAAATVAV